MTKQQSIDPLALAAKIESLIPGDPLAAELRRLVAENEADREIVDQTEELAALLMKEFQQRVKADPSSNFRASRDIRARHCWIIACRIQEMLTGTDPENAASELENEE